MPTAERVGPGRPRCPGLLSNGLIHLLADDLVVVGSVSLNGSVPGADSPLCGARGAVQIIYPCRRPSAGRWAYGRTFGPGTWWALIVKYGSAGRPLERRIIDLRTPGGLHVDGQRTRAATLVDGSTITVAGETLTCTHDAAGVRRAGLGITTGELDDVLMRLPWHDRPDLWRDCWAFARTSPSAAWWRVYGDPRGVDPTRLHLSPLSGVRSREVALEELTGALDSAIAPRLEWAGTFQLPGTGEFLLVAAPNEKRPIPSMPRSMEDAMRVLEIGIEQGYDDWMRRAESRGGSGAPDQAVDDVQWTGTLFVGEPATVALLDGRRPYCLFHEEGRWGVLEFEAGLHGTPVLLYPCDTDDARSLWVVDFAEQPRVSRKADAPERIFSLIFGTFFMDGRPIGYHWDRPRLRGAPATDRNARTSEWGLPRARRDRSFGCAIDTIVSQADVDLRAPLFTGMASPRAVFAGILERLAPAGDRAVRIVEIPGDPTVLYDPRRSYPRVVAGPDGSLDWMTDPSVLGSYVTSGVTPAMILTTGANFFGVWSGSPGWMHALGGLAFTTLIGAPLGETQQRVIAVVVSSRAALSGAADLQTEVYSLASAAGKRLQEIWPGFKAADRSPLRKGPRPPRPPPPACRELLLRCKAARGRVHEFRVADRVTIGRDADCEIVLADPRVSRRHATVVRDGGRFFLRDLKSGNSTLLNGEAVLERTCLIEGDEIEIDPFILHVTLVE
ncbi:MAG: FHA domain-containing protein [Candidatus Riflebacteria bacterium]|nr:FHA domain-containing protein [Candidatus Riflebacteria bacterium]